MSKIEFYLKKPNDGQESLEHITISGVRKVLEGRRTGQYLCEISSSMLETKTLTSAQQKMPAYSPTNPIDALMLAVEGAKNFLQLMINLGYTVKDIESKQEWKLEKKSPQSLWQEKVEAVKNDPNISSEVKKKEWKNTKKYRNIFRKYKKV